MSKKTKSLYYLIPLLHIFLIVLFLFLQFKPDSSNDLQSNKVENGAEIVVGEEKGKRLSWKEKREIRRQEKLAEKTSLENRKEKEKKPVYKSKFKKEFGPILVYSKKKAKVSRTSAKLSSAVLESMGFAFLFNDKKNMTWISPDGKYRKLELKEVSYSKKLVALKMTEEITVQFFIDSNDSVRIGAVGKNGGVVQVAMSEVDNSQLVLNHDGSSMTSVLKKRKYSYLFQSATGSEEKVLNLVCLASGDQSARLINGEKNDSTWKAILSLKKDVLKVEEVFYKFREKAYQGWTIGRYSDQNKKWKMADGTGGISADLINAFALEAYSRNRPEQFLLRMKQTSIFNVKDFVSGKYTVEINPAILDMRTALLFGSLKKNYDQATKKALAMLGHFRESVDAKEYSIFLDANLSDAIVMWGSPKDEKVFVNFLISGMSSAKSVELISIIIQGIRFYQLYPEFRVQLKAPIEKALEKLACMVAFDGENVWITNNGKAMPFETIKAGLALELGKTILKINQYARLSSLLIESGEKVADSNGFLPEMLQFGSLQGIGGKRAPEELYNWLVTQSCAPRAERLKSETAGTVLVYHRANKVSFSESDGVLNLDFKHWFENGSEYNAIGVLDGFYIKSLPSFKNVAMWDNSSWPGDSSFEYWRVGYYYFKSEKLLAAMLRHRKTVERFSLIW